MMEHVNDRTQFAAEIDKRPLPGEDIILRPQNIDSNMFFDTIHVSKSK